jgi:TRAP-type C4-dicarboxylate transport system substrate-binding protein
MAKKTIHLIAVIPVFLFLLSRAPARAEDSVFEIKAATLATRGVGWTKHVEEDLSPEVLRCSDGKIRLKLYYGGIMGDEAEVIRKIRAGTLHTAGLSGQGTVLACPEFSILELPFMFNDYNEVDYIRAKMFPAFAKLMESRGFMLFMWWDQDFDQLYSIKQPITKLEDFKGCRFLTWYGTVEERLLLSLGAQLVPKAPTDAIPAIKQGLADAAIAPAIFMVGFQAYSVARYVNPIKIRYSPITVIFTNDFWNSLPKKFTNCTMAERDSISAKIIEGSRRDSEQCLAAMLRYGVIRVKTDPDDEAKLRAAGKAVWGDLTGTLYAKDLLEELIGHLSRYRHDHG